MTYFEKLHKGIRLDAEVFLPKEAATVRHLLDFTFTPRSCCPGNIFDCAPVRDCWGLSCPMSCEDCWNQEAE